MKLKELYQFAVEGGMNLDPRGKSELKRILKKVKRDYEDLKPEEKEVFDKERFKNPYADTRILYGDGRREVRSILVGIDLEIGEVLMAQNLRQQGRKIDLLLSHHPEGRALASIYEVMPMQADILSKYGVPINVAEGILEGRIREVERKLMPLNHARAVDAARLLDTPYICIHTPADNFAASYLQRRFDGGGCSTLEEVMELLRSIPEYKEALKENVGPKIIVGSKENRAGKIFVNMTGGTEGSKEIFEKLAQAGVGTIVDMHMVEENRKEAERHHINVVIAGHIASDSLGLNLLLDKLMKRGRLELIPCSGFIRVKRR